MFKLANSLLIEFSKAPQAWQVVFEVLEMGISDQNPLNVSDNEMMQAAIILKNKFMFDFVALKSQQLQFGQDAATVTIQMRDKMMGLVQSLARPLKSTGKPAPRFILNVVCTSVAYFSMHAHPYWPTLIGDLANSLA